MIRFFKDNWYFLVTTIGLIIILFLGNNLKAAAPAIGVLVAMLCMYLAGVIERKQVRRGLPYLLGGIASVFILGCVPLLIFQLLDAGINILAKVLSVVLVIGFYYLLMKIYMRNRRRGSWGPRD